MLTTQSKSAYNGPIVSQVLANRASKKHGGRRKPEYPGVQSRLTSTRLSGFFVRSYHLLTSEACGQLRAGRFLDIGISYPQRLAHPP